MIIRTVNLKKAYVKKDVVTEALRGVDAEIFTGEFISLMGPSGSGKSTFFNMVGGLDSPTSGRVFIDEVDVAQLTAMELAFLRCRKIGYIFQTYNLIQYMTALENVTMPMAFAGVDSDEARDARHGASDAGGPEGAVVPPAHRNVRRPAAARGHRPLDGQPPLDPPVRRADREPGPARPGREILEILRMLNQERGVTIICATHDHRMLDICDRLIWIRDGRIERIARRDEVQIEVGSIGGEKA